jgi:MraZ protein
MFFGTYTPKLDEKGRLFLPAKFRDELTEGLVVTRGQERCLTVWSLADFEKLTDRLREAPVTQKNTRDYVRMLFAAASQEVPDKQGRINIPAPLREYASLRKECVVIGSMNRIEIWDPERWRDYSAEAQAKFADLDEAPDGSA